MMEYRTKNNIISKTFCFSKEFFCRTFTIVVILLIHFGFLLASFFVKKIFPSSVFGKELASEMRFKYERIASIFDKKSKESIKKINLIELSMQNMRVRKVRSMVTVGGMTVGIAIIFFLVSIGYGVEELVISRVAKLEEMRQTEVALQPGSKIKIDDETLSKFKSLEKVESVMPIITSAGKIDFNNSVTDVAVYGVTADYIKKSDIKVSQGAVFESNDLVYESAPIEIKKEVENVDGKINFSINEGEWIKVRSSADKNADIVGYTKKVLEYQTGKEVEGSSYLDNENGQISKSEGGEVVGKWIEAEIPLWKKNSCKAESAGCEDGYESLLDANGNRKKEIGYFAEINIVKIDEAETVQVENASKASVVQKREAVVSESLASILDSENRDVVGKKFLIDIVPVGKNFNQDSPSNIKLEYTIIGVVAGVKTPLLYVPFINLRSLGMDNYSEVKIIANSQNDISKIRTQIGAMGYGTSSVIDTIDQIDSYFKTIRTTLFLVGMVALAVAALGMFNTMTISLLERTREVGLMKAMGMRSSEVYELFLTESLIMGILGGFFGIVLGFVSGKLLGTVLSVFSVYRGFGYIDVTHAPFTLVLVIVLISSVVGIVTGIYPARRAEKISALNALRYE